MPRSASLPRRLRRRSAVLGLAAALAGLTACGGGSNDAGSASSSSASSGSATSSSAAASSPAADDSGSSSSAPAGETQKITATEADFTISLDSTDLPAGDYEIDVVNNGGATHDLRVEKDGADIAKSDTIAPGESGTVTVSLAPGEYVFYCSIGAHRVLGMEVTVNVT